jgi:hypothetical protein
MTQRDSAESTPLFTLTIAWSVRLACNSPHHKAKSCPKSIFMLLLVPLLLS